MIAALVAEVTALDGATFAGLLLMFLAGCMWLAGRIGRWFARGDADLDRLVSDALDERDFEANKAARWQG